MYGFFYNILATLTGRRSFEQLKPGYASKARSTLDGSKLSELDARVFGNVLKRQKGEGFFAYIDRKRKLAKLPLEDKQRLIESEKKRLIAEEKRKRALLDEFLDGTNKTEAQNQAEHTKEQVHDALNNRLTSRESSLFDTLASRKQAEPLFSYLKRSKAMYRLPIEEKKLLVRQEQSRLANEKASQRKALEQYLKPSPYEVVSQTSSKTDKAMKTKNAKGLSR